MKEISVLGESGVDCLRSSVNVCFEDNHQLCLLINSLFNNTALLINYPSAVSRNRSLSACRSKGYATGVTPESSSLSNVCTTFENSW